MTSSKRLPRVWSPLTDARQDIAKYAVMLAVILVLEALAVCLTPPRLLEVAIHRQAARQATIFRVTKERWAQIGITIEFLIVVRTLGEFFRLRHVLGTNFSTAVAALYVGGALIAACSCWVGVTLYFFRRYVLSASITLATIPVLLLYKIAEIGR